MGRLDYAVNYYLRYACAVYDATGTQGDYAFYYPLVEELRADSVQRFHAECVAVISPRSADLAFINNIVRPLYSFWRDRLIAFKMHAELENVASFLCSKLPKEVQPLFDKAYAMQSLGRNDDAEGAYRELLNRDPNDTASLFNLSFILEQRGHVDDARELSRQAAELAPTESSYCKRTQLLDRKLEEKQAEHRRQDEFLRTARERWPQLDFHKRRILSALTVIESFESLEHLAKLSGTGEQYVKGNWRKLVDLGMVVEDAHGKPHVNPHILDLVKQERSHSVATTLIRADSRIAFKPIFNSKLEYTVYSALIGLFPNHLVFPNMSLQTVFQYERIRELVDSDTFRYYLMSQVDFCVTSTASYLPIIAFEVDSPYHDRDTQKERDRKKNAIFQVGGVPLLRLRAHGQPTSAAIRDEIVAIVRDLGHELDQTQREAGGFVNLTFEIDFERFGGPPNAVPSTSDEQATGTTLDAWRPF